MTDSEMVKQAYNERIVELEEALRLLFEEACNHAHCTKMQEAAANARRVLAKSGLTRLA